MRYKQRSGSELYEAQRERKSEIQTLILRIVDGTPARPTFCHRTDIGNPGPFNEVARGEMPYEPFEKGLLMLRDAARSAHRKCDKARQDQVRANIRALLAAIERYALEPLPEESEADVIPLMLAETEAQSSADRAEDLAKVALTPERLLDVARALDPQIRVSTRLKQACLTAANSARSTPRPTHLSVAR